MNLNRLKKEEILWLHNHKCKHGHTFLEHPQCVPEKYPISEKVGFFDIETTGLKGDYCFILSYCLKEVGGKILGRVLSPQEIRSGVFDRKLLAEMIKDIRKFDKIVGYYSGDFRFDIPIIRTRAIKHGIDFPLYKEVKAVDLYPIVKKKLNLHNRRLGTVCSFFGIEAKGHMMSPDVWAGAISGNKKSLNYVFTHNKEDVISTEKLYNKIIEFVGQVNASI